MGPFSHPIIVNTKPQTINYYETIDIPFNGMSKKEMIDLIKDLEDNTVLSFSTYETDNIISEQIIQMSIQRSRKETKEERDQRVAKERKYNSDYDRFQKAKETGNYQEYKNVLFENGLGKYINSEEKFNIFYGKKENGK